MYHELHAGTQKTETKKKHPMMTVLAWIAAASLCLAAIGLMLRYTARKVPKNKADEFRDASGASKLVEPERRYEPPPETHMPQGIAPHATATAAGTAGRR